MKDASKLKAKYQYVLQDKKQLQNRVHYLEDKLSEVTEKDTLVKRNSETTLTDNISQAISNLVSLHYSIYGEKQVGQEMSDVA